MGISTQLVQRRLRLLQIGAVETLCELAVYRGEKVGGLGGIAVEVPEAGETRRSAEFPHPGGMGAGDIDGLVVAAFCHFRLFQI